MVNKNTILKVMTDPQSKLSVEFWLSHIIIIISTVLGVYLAASAGFDVAIEFEKTRMDREVYFMERALFHEVKDNVKYAKKYSSDYINGAVILKRGANNELDTFIWKTMTNSNIVFQMDENLLTPTRRLYSVLSKNLLILSKGNNHLAARQILKDATKAIEHLIPNMEKIIKAKERDLKQRNIID
jgi:hypothetical protein